MDNNLDNIQSNFKSVLESTPNNNLGNHISDVNNDKGSDGINTIRMKMESYIFNIGKTQDKAQEFINERDVGWTHGVKPPYTIFKYQKLPIGNPKNIFNKIGQEKVFFPKAVFEEIDHASLNRNGKSLSSESSNHDDHHSEHKSDFLTASEGSTCFSGYYSIPKTTLNVPNSFTLDKHYKKLVTELPEICYQNHVDLDDITYTFGGVYANKYSDFRELGLPIDVDPKKISIYFPCEFPPHVDKDILISPYMTQNPHLIIFNSYRSTVSYCDTYSSSSYPAHLNNASGCPISKNHIFFYGGFEIIVENVDYVAEIDRWIIKKKLVMNEKGYVLDVKTLKFTEITLESKNKELFEIGRLGNSIAANILESSPDDEEKQNKCILPPVFADIDSNIPSPSSPSVKPMNFPESSRSDNIKALDSSNVSITTSLTNASNEKYMASDIETSAPASASSSYSFNFPRQLNSLKSIAGQSESSKATPTTSNTKSTSVFGSTHGANGPKISQALSKSSKIFHRHQKQASGSAPKSPSSHPLKNTYSNQVRDNRSNSQNSRPVSPILIGNSSSNSNSQKPTTNHISNNVDSKLQNNSNLNDKKKETVSNVETELRPSNTLIAYVATNASAIKNDGTPDVEDTGFKNTENDNSFECRSKSASISNNLVTEFDGKVSVFIFGGFECHQDGHGFQRFRATNKLLRIDITCKKILFVMNFENEASILIVGANGIYSKQGESIHSDIWPSPRGYFAYALIDHKQNIDDNCFWDIESINSHQTEPDDLINDESFDMKCSRVTSPVSNNMSSSSTSLQTTSNKCISSKTQKAKSIESFFNNKALLVQGGCNENFETFSEFYIFDFEAGKWLILNTYVHNYFKSPIQPYEDDDSSIFVKENEDPNPKQIDAELRSCHHTALYYKNDEKDYLFFMGGFTNDYLRFFDKEPYKSGKFDVSRLCKLQFAPTNTNILRVMILNLQTQTWKFLRYYYDMNHSTHENFLKMLHTNPGWNNARINNFGGCVSLNGKAITICHGMAIAVPEKREDMSKLKKDIPDTSILWGAHVRFTFPSL